MTFGTTNPPPRTPIASDAETGPSSPSNSSSLAATGSMAVLNVANTGRDTIQREVPGGRLESAELVTNQWRPQARGMRQGLGGGESLDTEGSLVDREPRVAGDGYHAIRPAQPDTALEGAVRAVGRCLRRGGGEANRAAPTSRNVRSI